MCKNLGHPMPSYKFKIGDVVTLKPAISRNVPDGIYQVTKRLPENWGTLFSRRSRKQIDESASLNVPNLSHLRRYC